MESSTEARSEVGRRILLRIFGNVPGGFAARLWDGTMIRLGRAAPPFTLVFHDPQVFGRLMFRPNTKRFAEAYADGQLAVEGDLFAAIGLANRIEQLQLGLRERIAILFDLLRLGRKA